MHENAAIREWSVVSDVAVKFSFQSVPSIPRGSNTLNIKNKISTLDFVLFFIFVIFAVVDMNCEFICFKIFF